MSKSSDYSEIIGCPKHGTTNGKVIPLRKDGENEKETCYKCISCKRIYIESKSEHLGRTKKQDIKSGYPVWNTVGPFPIPKYIFEYKKGSKVGLCSCKGSIKEKTKNITHFLLASGETVSVQGVRVCRLCKKAFATAEIIHRNSDLFEKNNIESIMLDESNQQEAHYNYNKKLQEKDREYILYEEWENIVFATDDYDVAEESYTELKPAGRVASAYYDAKISFNPYQYLPWLKMFVNNSSQLLISDEVGLGKTIEAGILIMEELTQNVNAKILVICPAFLREKWYQELYDKFFLDSQVYDGKTAIDSMTSIVILPISRIKQYIENACPTDYAMVVIDEVHYFKNSKSMRYKYLSHLLEAIGSSKRVFMSATPINNSGNDYYSIKRLFCAEHDRTNTTKKQAYIFLPERNIKDIYLELTPEEQAFYNTTDVLDPFSGTVYRHIGSSCLYALSRYAYSESELVSETKEELRNALDILTDGISYELDDSWYLKINNTPAPDIDSKLFKLQEILRSFKKGSKVVLFTHYIETVKYLHSELSKEFNIGYIYANNISNNIPCRNIRNKFIDAKEWFSAESNDTTILICSDSCREGIDLDIASILINYDLPFNPSILEQRIGRIDRMSQKKDMQIYNFHVSGTYDDRLHFILAAKLRFIDFYSNYGVGNPLNITSEGNDTFDSFIRYFGRKVKESKDFATMSNDDFYVASRILRQIGVTIEKAEGTDAVRMQSILLNKMEKNKAQIEKWFDKGELKKITEEQLIKQRDELEALLNFPPRIQRRVIIGEEAMSNILKKANNNPKFRKRIAPLIKNYVDKLIQMEITGIPMIISKEEIREEYCIGEKNLDEFIQNSVIELLRIEGADVYEI